MKNMTQTIDAEKFAEAVQKLRIDFLKGKSSKGDWRLYLKTVVFFTSLIAFYCALYFMNAPTLVSLLVLAPLIGSTYAFIGFNVMHDAGHMTYSSKKWMNNLFGFLGLNLLGGNIDLWIKKHNGMHHTYVNVEGHDDDINTDPFLRLHHAKKWIPLHRFQHKKWYFLSVYSLSYLLWVWFLDYKKYFTGKICNERIGFNVYKHVMFWISKILHWLVFIIIPCFYNSIGYVVAVYVIAALVCGIIIGVVFQLAHIVEDTEKPILAPTSKERLLHQAKTTANFCPRNKVLSWFVGGLNYQIEHHLYPYISHIYYPELSIRTRDLFKAFNLQYIVNETFEDAIKSHVKCLEELSKKPIPVAQAV